MSLEYWYGNDAPSVALLAAVRRFRSADEEMRRRLGADMRMNGTDLAALRHVIAAERAGHPLTARELAEQLRISTAATAKLITRLTGSGHMARHRHPEDRRAVLLVATERSHRELVARAGPMHEAMFEVARSVPAEAREAVIGFLDAMTALFEEDAHRNRPPGNSD